MRGLYVPPIPTLHHPRRQVCVSNTFMHTRITWRSFLNVYSDSVGLGPGVFLTHSWGIPKVRIWDHTLSSKASDDTKYFVGRLGGSVGKHETLDSGSGHDLTVRGFEPHMGPGADFVEPAGDSLSLPLCPFPTGTHSLSHSLSLSLSLKIHT